MDDDPRTRTPAGRAAAPGDPPPGDRWIGALIGLLVAVAAVGAGELAAVPFGADASPVTAVGGAAIDASPEWLKGFAIRTFGEADKLVLLSGIAIVMAAAGLAIGAAAARRPWVGVAGVIAFGALGVAAVMGRPTTGTADAIPTVVASAVGLWSYRRLRRAAKIDRPVTPEDPSIRGFDRRRFLSAAAATVGVSGTAIGLARVLLARAGAAESRNAVPRAVASDGGRATPVGANLGVDGIAPFITPNDDFYRVDTALFVPRIDAITWRLRIHGMVDRELELDYEQLLARPLIERDLTLTCVSNEVGGPYVGNARWIGAPLADLLAEAGVDPAADQLLSRSADGFTAGTPTAVVTDGRDAIVAVTMNGEPLPLEHGFPARMIVPGLYGYVSATKWLVELELTTFEAVDPYWVQRGWAPRAPVKTQARIDTPRGFVRVDAGTVPVGGVAWAPHRGISRVEVQIDDGPWIETELAAEDTVDTWRQWTHAWVASPGRHTVRVRATDGDGIAQTAERVPPFPDGATGHHTIVVDVD